DLVSQNISPKQKQQVLDARQESYDYYAWIGLTDMQGKVQVATRALLEGADVSQRPWFQNALEGIHVGDVHDAKLLAKLLPTVDGDPERFVDVAFPYHDDQGKPAGVLGVHLSWQWAREIERSIFEPIGQ